jgi:hypothetical protein
MQLSRSFSAFTVLLLTSSAVFLAQATGSNSGQVAHVERPQASDIPWTLARTTTIVQTLANGTTVTCSFTVKEAQDAEGRTYTETHQILHVRADGQPIAMVSDSVFDPVARTRTTWGNQTRVANVIHIPAPDTTQVLNGQPQQPHIGRPTEHQTSEDLGVRTIAGIETKGTRRTGTIPVGDWGNDRPLTIVTENWDSTQYNIPMLAVTDDPRSEKRTDEVTEFQAGNPNPALFQIPVGYTIRERDAH